MIEAMKQALEALENLQGLCSEEGNFIEQLTIWTPEAMYALRTAIEQAEKHEPVAWMDASETALSWENYLDGMKPLYTTPPAAQRNRVAQWMIAQGYATGHGDTVEDLLQELEWQVRESEREACAKVCDDWPNGRDDVYSIGAAIRARGNT